MLEFLSRAEWAHYVNAAQVLSAIAMGIAAIVGAGSLLAIVVQTRTSARVAHEAMAMDVHKEMMKLSIQYPQLSSSTMAIIYIRKRNFRRILEKDSDTKVEEVLWFLSYVLFAMEQILSVTRRRGKVDRAWFETARDVLGYHQETLREVWPDWRSHYGPVLGRVVDEVLRLNVGPNGLLETVPTGTSSPAA